MQKVTENVDLTHHIRELTHQVADRCQLRFIWFPGHADLEGNERADDQASRAAAISSLGYCTNRGERSARFEFL